MPRFETKKLFLESAFISTQIIDLKINKERNIPKEYSTELQKACFQMLNFSKVHFFLAEPANNNVKILGSNELKCRTLEDEEWNKYLGEEYNTRESIVYHIRQIAKGDKKDMTSFACLIKAEMKKTNYRIIACYMFFVIVLGALGSFLCSYLSKFL